MEIIAGRLISKVNISVRTKIFTFLHETDNEYVERHLSFPGRA